MRGSSRKDEITAATAQVTNGRSTDERRLTVMNHSIAIVPHFLLALINASVLNDSRLLGYPYEEPEGFAFPRPTNGELSLMNGSQMAIPLSQAIGHQTLHVMNRSSLLIYPDDQDFANYTDLMGLLSSNTPTRELA